MKKLFTLSACAMVFSTFAQTNAPGITVSPMGTDGSVPITVTMTLAEVCLGGSVVMDGTWNSIKFHSGAIVGTDGWQNTVGFDAANAISFERVSDGVFSATFTPDEYYGIDADGFSFVFNGSGNTDGDWDAEAKAFNEVEECTDFYWYFNDEPASIETNAIQAVSVYPNPAKNVINFSATLNGASAAQVVVTDLAGRVVANAEILAGAELNLNIANFAEGTYMYTVVAGESVVTGKFTKQ